MKILAIKADHNAHETLNLFTGTTGYTPVLLVDKNKFVGPEWEVVTKIILIVNNGVAAVGNIVDMFERVGLGTGRNTGWFVFHVENVEINPQMYVPSGILMSKEYINYFEIEERNVN